MRDPDKIKVLRGKIIQHLDLALALELRAECFNTAANASGSLATFWSPAAYRVRGGRRGRTLMCSRRRSQTALDAGSK